MKKCLHTHIPAIIFLKQKIGNECTCQTNIMKMKVQG